MTLPQTLSILTILRGEGHTGEVAQYLPVNSLSVVGDQSVQNAVHAVECGVVQEHGVVEFPCRDGRKLLSVGCAPREIVPHQTVAHAHGGGYHRVDDGGVCIRVVTTEQTCAL